MRPKILVVDDNDDARELLSLVLEAEGFWVASAPDGKSALELIEIDRPDLVITDIQMPVLDGIGMIKLMRARPETSRIPILVISAFPGRIEASALEAGANVATHKPLELDKLIRLVKRLLPGIFLGYYASTAGL